MRLAERQTRYALVTVDPPVLTLRQASVKNGLVARLAQKVVTMQCHQSLETNMSKDSF